MISLVEDQKMLGYEVMASYPDISCFVTTRRGGCSLGSYASFNCTPYTGDDPECVARNCEILCASLTQRPKELIIPVQTHDTRILNVDHRYLQASASERSAMLQGIDALTTRLPGCCICISTADCVPILLYDRAHKAIAAVHAGWRGTVNRLLKQTLEEMQRCYNTRPVDVVACIGPSISQAAFEVGEEVYEAFFDRGFPMDYIAQWRPETHKHHIDLWAANRMQLLDFGVPAEQVENAQICTYTRHDLFFSARRLGIKSGRILSGIMINE